jgi:sugar phosphate isomerase/epimerase
MKLLFMRSKWDLPDLSLKAFLSRVKESGFDGSDIYVPDFPFDPIETQDLHEELGLRLVCLIATEGATPREHIASLDTMFQRAARFKPFRLNSHTGKDWFSAEDNIRIFRRSLELSAAYGIPISHETHRGRALFSAPASAEILTALPDLRITADFSHWCCVHESLLQDQSESLRLAIERTDYIHARVGHAEAPQVSDPRAPEWKAELERHLDWWERIIRHHRRKGTGELAICPEFGPPPYMPLLPYTGQPVADVWEVNLFMKDLIKQRFAGNDIATAGKAQDS